MSLGPVVAGARLAEHKVVWSEDLAEWTRTNRVHGAWLQIDKNGTWHVLAAGCLIVVNIDALQLQIAVAMVGASGIDAMLVGNYFPELKGESELIYKTNDAKKYLQNNYRKTMS